MPDGLVMEIPVKIALKLLFTTAGVLLASISSADSINCGSMHSLAVTGDRNLWSWGGNGAGQLGYETLVEPEPDSKGWIPKRIEALSNITKVACGRLHSMAVSSEGSVWGWGLNSHGQLGDGTTTSRSTPHTIAELSSVVSIACGAEHSAAVLADGSVWAWGANARGQLGDNTTETRSFPVRVKNIEGIRSVGAGSSGFHTLALANDGTVWTWGANSRGQLGDGTTNAAFSPVRVTGIQDVVSVSAGSAHSIALKSDGTVWAWGDNSLGQLGDGRGGGELDTDSSFSAIPVQVAGLSNILKATAGGNAHSLAIDSEGMVWAWGDNKYGQIGDGEGGGGVEDCRTIPVHVISVLDAVEIACGDYHSMAVRLDGTVWTWGKDEYCQLGDGQTNNTATPVQAVGILAATYEASPFGTEGYTPLSGDFDGDGRADKAVYSDLHGAWFIELSRSAIIIFMHLGGIGHDPILCDFDGDGKADPSVYEESTGLWQVLMSDDNYSLAHTMLGGAGCIPVCADFDGDGKADPCVYEENEGYWHALLSGSGYRLVSMQFGGPGYIPLSADYDGDGRSDPAVYHHASGTWFIFLSASGSLAYAQFGFPGCSPVKGDFDGDGYADLAVFDPSSAVWHILRSSDSTIVSQTFGDPDFLPVPARYGSNRSTDIGVYDPTTGYWYINRH